jgi:hypothetical protein
MMPQAFGHGNHGIETEKGFDLFDIDLLATRMYLAGRFD